MASNLLNTLEKIEKGRKKCIRLANEVNYPLPEDASLEQIAQCINAQGYADEYYESYKAWFTKDYSALPDGKVRLPDEIEKLGNKAFYYGENIDFIWPRNLKEIGTSTFSRVTFKNNVVDIPNTVTTIGSNAFDYVKNVTYNIPSSVTNIGSSAFGHSTSCTINFDGRVENLVSTFSDGNTSTVGIDGPVNFTDEAIACIKTIGLNAFNNRELNKLPWNENTRFASTHTYAFQYCRWLLPVVFPKSLYADGITELSSQVLQGNEFRQGFEFEPDIPIKSFGTYAMNHTKMNNDKFIIPENVTTFNTQCCASVCKYNEQTPTSTTTQLDTIEVTNKSSVTIGNQAFNNAYYKDIIIYAPKLTMNNSNQAFMMTSSSSAQGNVVFLNMETVPTITSNTFSTSNLSKGSAKVYIPDDLVTEAKAKQYWSAIASYIKPLSEWPLYAEYAEHILPREGA